MLGVDHTCGADTSPSPVKARLGRLQQKQDLFALLAEIDEALQASTSSVDASTANHSIKQDRSASINDLSHRTEKPTSDPSSTAVSKSVADRNITKHKYGPSSHELGLLTSLVKEAVASNSDSEIHGTGLHPNAESSYLLTSAPESSNIVDLDSKTEVPAISLSPVNSGHEDGVVGEGRYRKVTFDDNVMEKTISFRSVSDSFSIRTDDESKLSEIFGANLSDLDLSTDSSPDARKKESVPIQSEDGAAPRVEPYILGTDAFLPQPSSPTPPSRIRRGLIPDVSSVLQAKHHTGGGKVNGCGKHKMIVTGLSNQEFRTVPQTAARHASDMRSRRSPLKTTLLSSTVPKGTKTPVVTKTACVNIVEASAKPRRQGSPMRANGPSSTIIKGLRPPVVKKLAGGNSPALSTKSSKSTPQPSSGKRMPTSRHTPSPVAKSAMASIPQNPKISSSVSDPFDVAEPTSSPTFKLHSPFPPIRIQDGRPTSDDEDDDTTLDGLQGPGPLAMLTGVDNEGLSVQDEFMALKPDMDTILRSNILIGDGKSILDEEFRSVSRMSFLEDDCKSDLSKFSDDQSVLGEDDLLPLAKDDCPVALPNEQPKGLEGLPSPGTFFAALSGQLGSLEGKTDERNRPVFATPKKDRYGNIVETIELTPTVTTVVTPNGSRLVRAPLYASPTDKVAPQPRAVEPSFAAFTSTQKTKEADTRQPRLPLPDLFADMTVSNQDLFHRDPLIPDIFNNNMLNNQQLLRLKWPRDNVTPKPVIELPGTWGSTTMNTRPWKTAPSRPKQHTNYICFPPVTYRAVSRVIVSLQNPTTKSAIWEVSAIGKPLCEDISSASTASSSTAPTVAKRKHVLGQDSFVFAHTSGMVEAMQSAEVIFSFHPSMVGHYSQTFHLRCNGQVVVVHVEGSATVPIYKQQKLAVSGGLERQQASKLKSSVASTKAPSSLASSISKPSAAHRRNIHTTAASAEILSVTHCDSPCRQLVFNDVHVGKTRTIAITLNNVSPSPNRILTVDVTTPPSFHVQAKRLRIMPEKAMWLEVSFRPHRAGVVEGEVIIRGAGGAGVTRIKVSGRGVVPGSIHLPRGHEIPVWSSHPFSRSVSSLSSRGMLDRTTVKPPGVSGRQAGSSNAAYGATTVGSGRDGWLYARGPIIHF
ncbi:hypothetical protein SeLEV6574_g02789 [Synchytrium endobioticum]|nr:hypothetical protein SeLEV6574_g02789 [Synchytrium endobioticum]